MSEYLIQSETLTAIADAIRAKNGSTDPIAVADMATAISEITGGGSSEDVYYVTFMSEDGTQWLYRKAVLSGDNCMNPVEMGWSEAPVKDPTTQLAYTYSGWSLAPGGTADSSALESVTEDRTVYAAFTESTRYYTVRFFDGETLLKTEQVAYGGKATPPEVTSEFGYVFAGWQPVDLTITADTDFVCEWSEDTSKIIVVKEQSVSTAFDDNIDAYIGSATTIVDPVAESTYVVVFDGVEYECIAKKISLKFGTVLTTKFPAGIGNPYVYKKSYGYSLNKVYYTDTNETVLETSEPFFLSCKEGIVSLYTQEAGDTHTLCVYMRTE